MRLEWLEDILAVAETGSLREAAERRHLTQSAFSRRVQHIEDYVGIALFDRSRKPVQLHPATAEQREEIARLARKLHQLTDDLRRSDRTAGNRLALASQHALTASWAPRFIERVQSENKDVFFKLRSANLEECFALLLSRQADLAVAYRVAGEEHRIAATYIETLSIGRDRLVPVFARSRADHLNDRIEQRELPCIAYPPEVFFGDVLNRILLPRMRNTMRIVPMVETALTQASLELAASGIGVAWVPQSLARDRTAAGELVDLSAVLPICDLEVTAVRIAGPATHAEALVWEQLKG
ncbi:LysR family transcriptional regulator [Bosea sp. (in: a-proteobacteria)]|uniref:LysR family transcriptional regulator n=1 Tax=Bosea sp. (in: a-proteobacteria) TaxID=1871050 RepID=UPI002637FCE1|nr:LysR family transcriptional regulator [Bosea sp. (in: a-proteobacteria)]MCO5091303.1 LysR family transcriptional regulator [Bosea sp. (in: a-proteobacteria)]